MGSYEVDYTSGRGLVFGTLGEEEQTLSGLTCPCGSRVLCIRLFGSEEGCEGLRSGWLLREPEEMLGEEEFPDGLCVSIADPTKLWIHREA